MRLYWLLLIIPFLILSVMDVKKAWNKIKEARRNPEARADAMNLGLSVCADCLHGADDPDDARGGRMIFWISPFVITVTMDWLIVNASTEEEELVAAVLGIIAMIMILVYFVR